jgi:hypothetical protein
MFVLCLLRLLPGGLCNKFASFLDENDLKVECVHHVAFTKTMAAIRRGFKKPEESGVAMKFLSSAACSTLPAAEQLVKFLAFVQSKLFTHMPVQFIKVAELAHQLVTAKGTKTPDRIACAVIVMRFVFS